MGAFEAPLAMDEMPTIFRETAKGLARQLQEAAVDHEAFERGLAVCDLGRCRATCCHDGAILSTEEATVLAGLDDRDGIEALSNGKSKTRTKAAQDSGLADDFPAHFPKTKCVYLDGLQRCRWQLKAVEEGKHPWFYKPTSCWMHPVLLTQQSGRPLLTILSREDDRAGFASHTPCGNSEGCTEPARSVMGMELDMLGRISGRDFLKELNAPSI